MTGLGTELRSPKRQSQTFSLCVSLPLSLSLFLGLCVCVSRSLCRWQITFVKSLNQVTHTCKVLNRDRLLGCPACTATWGHILRRPPLGLVLCFYHLKICIEFLAGALNFHFAQGFIYRVASPTWRVKNNTHNILKKIINSQPALWMY